MTSKKWVASVLIVLVASPFAVAALDAIGIGPFWEVEAPEWKAGYAWTFANRMNVEAQGHGGFIEESFDESFQMRGESHRTVLNTTMVIDEVPVYAVVDQWVPLKIVEGGEVRYESDGSENDSAPMEEAMVFCGIDCPESEGYYTRADTNPFFEDEFHDDLQEIRFLKFPLRHSSSWSVYRYEENDDGFRYIEEVQAKVVGKDLVNLPGVGSMDAIRIEASLTRESKDSIQRIARQELPPGMDLDLDMDHTMTYWYAPEAKTIVRMDVTQSQSMRLSFQGDSMSLNVLYEANEVLTDYSLQEGPERSLEETDKMRDFLKDLPDVTELSNQTWPFTLAASQYSVDTAQTESATLGLLKGTKDEVETSDFDALPDGMTIQWRHRWLETVDSDGFDASMVQVQAKQDWYKGDTLELSPHEHGLHEVTAYLLDEENRLVGLDVTIIEGYARWADRATGVPLPLVNGFMDRSFTANVFMEQVQVSLGPSVAAAGTLGLEGDYADGMSQERSTTATGGETIRFDSHDPYLVSTWTSSFNEFARVGDVAMITEVRYDRSAPFAEADWMWRGGSSETYDGVQPEPADAGSSGASACSFVMASCLPMKLVDRMDEARTPQAIGLRGLIG